MGRTYLAEYPRLAHEFDLTKNFPLSPTTLTHKSNKKVWWVGKECKHSWEAVVASRVVGNNCPVCASQKVLEGFNDFRTHYPELSLEWDYSRNSKRPEEYLPQSSSKVYWLCTQHQHSWEASLSMRVRGRGCPYCSGKKVLRGFNDLESRFPEVALEWDYAKNSHLPSEVTWGSRTKVWWVCQSEYSHSWQATVGNRTNGRGCPICSRRNSRVEGALARLLPGAVHGASITVEGLKSRTCSVDILLEKNKVVVEYDGWFYHKDHEDRDSRKTDALIGAGYSVIRVRESSTHDLKFLDHRPHLSQLRHRILGDRVEDTAIRVMQLVNSVSLDTYSTMTFEENQHG